MNYEETRLSVRSLLCISCGGSATLPQVQSHDGACPACGSNQFNATLVKSVEWIDDSLGDTWAGKLFEQVVDMAGNGRIPMADGKHTTEYELSGVGGDWLIELMGLPVERALEQIQAQIKAAAIRNLRPDQRVCPVCATPYTIALAGPAKQGYCSSHCMEQGGAHS
jgi:RNA polymerase subunit RPABC4/transcription elongation factor Spt4